jgi:hypothetical protein
VPRSASVPEACQRGADGQLEPVQRNPRGLLELRADLGFRPAALEPPPFGHHQARLVGRLHDGGAVIELAAVGVLAVLRGLQRRCRTLS